MKPTLRKHWKNIRDAIPCKRRLEAENQLLEAIKTLSLSQNTILSFFSFGKEVSTLTINSYLAESHQLILPRFCNKKLEVYHIHSLSTQCTPNKWGIFEPIPSLCKKISIKDISTILVPGIVFDKENHRLGYGKGYYDRLLANISDSTQSIGLGYYEQLSPRLLPIETHDISLDILLLF